MEIKIKKLHEDAIVPHYAHHGDAGLDLRTIEDATISPGEKVVLKTGLAMEIPEGYAALIWDRSGLAARQGIHTMAGVIDSTYRGEFNIVLVNLGRETVEIKKGERIAQALIQPVSHAKILEVEELSETKRGESGLGSTGLK